MKIKKIKKTKSSLIKLKLLQARNYKKIYYWINLNIKNVQYRFVKSLKILYKYVSNNKTVLFLNKVSVINVTLKRLVTKTKHIFISNFIELKNKKMVLNSDLFFILTKKVDMFTFNQFCNVKIPIFLMTNNFGFKDYNFEINYKILGNMMLKKNQHFLFFIFLYSIMLKKHKFINLWFYMMLKKKNRYRPHYKQLINLKENLQNKNKLLNFKKKKWQKFILIYKRKLKLYKKIKPKDQSQYFVSKHSNIFFAYKKEYKNILREINKFKLIYGGLLNKTIKLLLNNSYRLINRIVFLKVFESRLDIILFRCKFGSTIRFIRQLIAHGKVFVNNKKTTIKSFILKSGDTIKIKLKSYQSFKSNVLYSMWLSYHKHLIVNHKTMEIVIVSLENNNYFLSLFYYIDLEKILLTKFKRK